jgi:hypothetical protein
MEPGGDVFSVPERSKNARIKNYTVDCIYRGLAERMAGFGDNYKVKGQGDQFALIQRFSIIPEPFAVKSGKSFRIRILSFTANEDCWSIYITMRNSWFFDGKY